MLKRVVVVCVPLLFLFLCLGQNASAQALANDDVIKMAQAQLPDSVIIAKIKSSRNEFDTSPNALIRLKQAGVSDAVLSVMIESTPTPAAASPASTRPGIVLPTVYGYYVVDGNEIRSLPAVGVETIIGISAGRNGIGVDGFSGDSPIAIRTPTPTIIAYQQNLDVNTLHLGELVYVSTMKAYEFNMFGTDPIAFSNVYKRDYNETISVRLWRPRPDVPVRIEPVENKPGMYRLTPSSALPPGRYAFYRENEIHRDGRIFATSLARKSEAFYFSVSGTTIDTTAVGAASRSAAAQPPPLPRAACTDSNSCTEAANAALRSSQLSEATTAWDKILGLGGTVTLSMCHERTLVSCEQGRFNLGPKEVSFATTTGQNMFAVAPPEVTSIRAGKKPLLPTASVQLRVGNRNYNFDFIPASINCELDFVVKCPPEGVAQQLAVANYIAQAIPKLTSGNIQAQSAGPPIVALPAPPLAVARSSSGDVVPPTVSFLIHRERPSSSRTPLILVHGIHGTEPEESLEQVNRYWENFLQQFDGDTTLKSKYDVYIFQYRSNVETVPKLAQEFGTWIDLELIDRPHVIVAHSMGGLIAKYYATEYVHRKGKWAGTHGGESILRLITLATPHHGTPAANDFGALTKYMGLGWKQVFDHVNFAYWTKNAGFFSVPSLNSGNPNRSDLRWDNYDGAITEDVNGWLGLVNQKFKNYASKLVAYGGWLAPKFPNWTAALAYAQIPAAATTYNDRARLNFANDALLYGMDRKFGSTDGLVPSGSALFCESGEYLVQAGSNFICPSLARVRRFQPGPTAGNLTPPDSNTLSIVQTPGGFDHQDMKDSQQVLQYVREDLEQVARTGVTSGAVMLAGFQWAGKGMVAVPFLTYEGSQYTPIPQQLQANQATVLQVRRVLEGMGEFAVYRKGMRIGQFNVTDVATTVVGTLERVVCNGTAAGFTPEHGDLAIAGQDTNQAFFSSLAPGQTERNRLYSLARDMVPKVMPNNTRFPNLAGRPITLGNIREELNVLDIDQDGKPELSLLLRIDTRVAETERFTTYVYLLSRWNRINGQMTTLLGSSSIEADGFTLWGEGPYNLIGPVDVNADGVAELLLTKKGAGHYADLEFYVLRSDMLVRAATIKQWSGS